MKGKRWIGIVALAVLGGGVLYFWFSPLLALGGLQRAIERKDTRAIERYVDFPAVKEDLKGKLMARMAQEAQKDTSGFGALGLLFAGALIDPLVEALVTPEGLAAIGTGMEPGQAEVGAVRGWQVRRLGFSEVFVHQKGNPDEGLVMRRKGLGWQVVRLELGQMD
ncbi:DUF2939 domain-containing protein [Meiothermus sp. QL-1]|uniref:DUF2939 domain-containing protein n=1 Tax=Meiothermus sp. QL-1 TaxID=2058095 RepID=UPI000E0C9554|nr:DUF2939 domain-containing protein [Meiothermus sp. QL-1]RDI96654.1 DUF2939 domain-containing protein [Meiothermus sp. QL-1]